MVNEKCLIPETPATGPNLDDVFKNEPKQAAPSNPKKAADLNKEPKFMGSVMPWSFKNGSDLAVTYDIEILTQRWFQIMDLYWFVSNMYQILSIIAKNAGA